MARTAAFALVLGALAVGLLMVYNADTSYKALPMDLDTTPEAVPYEEWQEYTSVLGQFTVMFPNIPQHATEELPVPESDLKLKYNMYVSEEVDGTTYMISLIEYPQELDTSNHDAMLENVMNEMVKSNPTNKIESLAFSDYEGNRALDFFIISPEIYINNRAFVVDKTLYLLTVIDKVEQYRGQDYMHFRDSFKLRQ